MNSAKQSHIVTACNSIWKLWRRSIANAEETAGPLSGPGRYPHIHFEVYPSLSLATLHSNKILTSQMALPRDISSDVYNNATGYSASIGNLSPITIANDNAFGDNSSAQITQQTAPALSGSVAAGYTGTPADRCARIARCGPERRLTSAYGTSE